MLGEDGGLHLHATIKVNGKNAAVVVDTGASRTVFDKERISRFVKKGATQKSEHLSSGLGTNAMESFHVDLNNIQLGKLQVGQYRTHLLDLGHVNKAYEAVNIETIDGILGSDLLLELDAIIDYSKKVIHLSQRSGRKLKKAAKKHAAEKAAKTKKASKVAAAAKKNATKKQAAAKGTAKKSATGKTPAKKKAVARKKK
jgi:hypothetical protein